MMLQKTILSNYLFNTGSMLGFEKWLSRFNSLIDKNLDNSFFNNQQFAEALTISERHLFRKMKELTGLSPQRYVSRYRLHKAMKYLENGKYHTVKETAYAVGFRNPSYFIRQFEKEFGKKPLRVLKEAGWR